MALSHMEVFNKYVKLAAIETITQRVQQFNAASAGGITLTPQGIDGDFLQESFWKSLASANRRVDRYASNDSESPTNLTQDELRTVKIAGGFGPVLFEPSQLTWIQESPEQAVAAISEAMADSIVADQLNTGILAAVAAISNNADAYLNGTSGAPTYRALNNTHKLFGDSSSALVCDVMNGATYHDLIDANLVNDPPLFQAGNVTVVGILGKRVVVTDAPALDDGGKPRMLSLVNGGITIFDGSDIETNIETNNGKKRIERTFQADYTFGLRLKGYSWGDGASPDDAALGTGANWDVVATSVKDTAGVVWAKTA